MPQSTRASRVTGHVGLEDVAAVQRESAVVFAKASEEPGTLFVQACHSLEEGALGDADLAAARLRATAPGRPEVAVLSALIAQRRQKPERNWQDAFLRAWNDAGRPNLRESSLLPAEEPSDDGETSVGLAWARAKKADTRLVAALAEGALEEEQQRWLAANLRDVTDPVLLRAAFEYFRGDALLPGVRAEALAVLRPRLQQLAGAAPQEMQTPLLLLLEQSSPDAPVTTGELQELERIASLSDYRATPLVRMHAEAERLLQSVGVARPEASAFSAVVSELALTGPYLLSKRAGVTGDKLSAAERERLGRALWAIGERVAEESTLVEHLVGLRLMKQGAEMLKEPERLTQVTAAIHEGQQMIGVAPALQVARWPIPSLQQAWLAATLENEWAHLRAFVAPLNHGE